MHSKTVNPVVRVLTLALLLFPALRAQPSSATLSGLVANPSGAPVAGAHISVKNLSTGQTTDAQTGADGRYAVPSLAPGDYEVSVSAAGFAPATSGVTLAAGAPRTLNLSLASTAPSLADLGFPTEAAKGNAAEQARLDKRSHMLKIHQRLGLITLAPLLATLITANGAKGRRGAAGANDASGRNLHAALGGVTAGLYFTTASFAIFAPKIPGTQVRGPIRLHRALAWIHGPGMILTPILGALAYQQRNRGQKVHGLAQLHGPVAVVTSAAFGLAVLSVSIKF